MTMKHFSKRKSQSVKGSNESSFGSKCYSYFTIQLPMNNRRISYFINYYLKSRAQYLEQLIWNKY